MKPERREGVVGTVTEGGGDVKKSLRGGTADGSSRTKEEGAESGGNKADISGGSTVDISSSSGSGSNSFVNRVAKDWKAKMARKLTRNKDTRPKSIVNAIFNRRARKTSTGTTGKRTTTTGSGTEKTTTDGGGRKGRTKGGGTLG